MTARSWQDFWRDGLTRDEIMSIVAGDLDGVALTDDEICRSIDQLVCLGFLSVGIDGRYRPSLPPGIDS